MSVRNYHCLLRNNPKEHISYLLPSGSLKYCVMSNVLLKLDEILQFMLSVAQLWTMKFPSHICLCETITVSFQNNISLYQDPDFVVMF